MEILEFIRTVAAITIGILIGKFIDYKLFNKHDKRTDNDGTN